MRRFAALTDAKMCSACNASSSSRGKGLAFFQQTSDGTRALTRPYDHPKKATKP